MKTDDKEATALARVVLCKGMLLEALNEAAQARKARGADTFGIEESIDLENATRAGYQRAYESRVKDLSTRGKR